MFTKQDIDAQDDSDFFRQILDHTLNGVAYCQMLYETGLPKDFIFLYTNQAFEELTGLRNVINKQVADVIPSIRQSDPDIFLKVDAVAVGSDPVKFEYYLNALGLWLSLSVFSPKRAHFVLLFEVISERKAQEEKLRHAEEIYRTLFDTVAQGLVYQDTHGRIISANPSAERILGLTLAQMQGRTSMDPQWCAIDETGAPFPGELHPTMVAIKTGKPVNGVVMGIKNPRVADTVWIEVFATPVFKQDSTEVDYVYSTFDDITEYKHNEELIRENSVRLKRILDNLFAYVALLDPNGVVEEVNKAPLERAGYRREDVVGHYFYDAPWWNYNAEVRMQLITAIHAAQRGVSSRYDVQVKMGNDLVPIDFQITPVLDSSGEIIGLLPTAVDITERKHLEEELNRQAYLDYLTGLPNRRSFMEQGEAELKRTRRYESTFSVLMLDIDHFKNINDAYGHPSGDFVLQKLAVIFWEVLRDVDITGRLGGEEFGIILPETPIDNAIEVAERLREVVAITEVNLPIGLQIYFTISIGVADLTDKSTNIEMLLNEADKALYRAKQAGRNKVSK